MEPVRPIPFNRRPIALLLTICFQIAFTSSSRPLVTSQSDRDADSMLRDENLSTSTPLTTSCR